MTLDAFLIKENILEACISDGFFFFFRFSCLNFSFFTSLLKNWAWCPGESSEGCMKI